MLKTVSSITNALGALNYQGTWDANTNNPALASGVGTKGNYYVVSVAGTTTLNGISTWYVGDWATFNGSVWQRLEGGVDDPALSLQSNSTTGLMQITGPAAGQTRVVTVPDANATMARSDAAQTFTGTQTFSSAPIISPQTAKNVSYYGASKELNGTSYFQYGRSAYDLAIVGNVSGGDNKSGARIDFCNVQASLTVVQASIRHETGWSTSTGRIVFATDASGGTAVDRCMVTEYGHLVPYTDNSYKCGDTSNRWTAIYAVNGTIQTSDGNDKEQIAELTDAEKRVAVKLKSLIRTFKMKDAVVAKGDAARIHVGAIAQDVALAFQSEGLDPNAYGIYCSDTWNEFNGQKVPVDENGIYTETKWQIDGRDLVAEDFVENEDGSISMPEKAVQIQLNHQTIQKTRLGIRYEEMLAFIISVL